MLEDLARQSYEYIKSDKGVTCVEYERLRIFTAILIGALGLALNAPGLLSIFIANKITKSTKSVTLTEWVIQKMFRKRSFASIRPTLDTIEDGSLSVSW